MTSNHRSLPIIAKCAMCSIKTELFVCLHCDEVICQTCVDKHQMKQSETLKENWNLCRTRLFNLCQLTDTLNNDMINVENDIDRIRSIIDKRYKNLLNFVEDEKNDLLNKIDEYVQSNLSNVKCNNLQTVFNSIDERLNTLFEDSDTTQNVEDFLLEIDHFNTKITNHENRIQTAVIKYPYLSTPKPLNRSDIFGELYWNSKPKLNYNSARSSTSDNQSFYSTKNENNSNETTNESKEATSLSMKRRQKHWSIDAAGVPHFLCLLSKKNHLLFACDKFGSIDLYQLDSNNSKTAPRHLRQFELFPGNTTSQQPLIIETFTVYTPYIVISAHLSEQTDTSSIYFFDHRGSQQSTTFLQNFPVRQLSADIHMKCLWGIDRQQHSVYYHQLPTSTQQIAVCIENREQFMKFDRDFEPIRINQNPTSIAIVERNCQSAHIFDKKTKTHTDQVENRLRTNGTFRLWNVLLRDDNSMVLKLDEDLPPNSRPPSINHLILDLDPKGIPITQIERTSVYGFAIGPNDEIFLGCKRHQQNGLIECYI